MAGDTSRPAEVPQRLRESDDWMIQSTFSQLGALWADEQAEGDDEGASQIEGIVKALRTYADHEAEEPEDDDDMAACPCCGWVATPCACC
jgi:hypothetical protein